MASHDDLDLIRLFGLSAEEAGGLGLAPSTQAPRAAPAASGELPTEIAVPAVLVEVVIGVTVLLVWLAT